ncbi:40S ribosomal protein S4 [Musa troglodytarum]|uniref:40S ribosomal protein S4 n=1 Tax=Musa troglodytarum TaxID=320322 RepID=A0A9E7I1B8_9LILI|nr:40S ribosomal protein S4 [Musa troglodytarum]
MTSYGHLRPALHVGNCVSCCGCNTEAPLRVGYDVLSRPRGGYNGHCTVSADKCHPPAGARVSKLHRSFHVSEAASALRSSSSNGSGRTRPRSETMVRLMPSLRRSAVALLCFSSFSRLDVVSIPKTNENFCLLYDTKGRFCLHSIRDEEAKFKLCKVRSVQFGQNGIPYLNTYDGRTIQYPDPLIKVNDTIKLDLETNKIVGFIKFDVGNVVMLTGRRNTGQGKL